MSLDISLIPQERIKDLVSTLDTIQNSLSNSVVHKSGNETITGEKTFTTCIRKTISTSWENIISMTGNNFPYIAGYSTDNDTALALCTLHNGNWCNIEIHNNGTGGYATIPTPATSDNSTKIATTNWVRTLGFTPNYSTQMSISLPYTAPANGFISGVLTAAHSENYYIKVNNIQVQRIYGETNQRVTAPFFIPVYRGDVISTTGGTNTVYFYYAR